LNNKTGDRYIKFAELYDSVNFSEFYNTLIFVRDYNDYGVSCKCVSVPKKQTV